MKYSYPLFINLNGRDMIRAVNIPIYNVDVAFGWEITKEELEDFIERNQERCSKEEIEGMRAFLGDYFFGLTKLFDNLNIVCFFKGVPTRNQIAHELYHVAYKICEPREIRDEEAMAYLVGYLTDVYYDVYQEANQAVIGTYTNNDRPVDEP